MTCNAHLALVLVVASLAGCLDPDSDGDGLVDRHERALGTSPQLEDTDGDGLDDGLEIVELGTDPLLADTDQDGFDDGFDDDFDDNGSADQG